VGLPKHQQCVENVRFVSTPLIPFSDGVYRSGFATSQAAYDKAVVEVFDGLDKVEKILSENEYLVGGKLTEADVRLWVTTVSFLLDSNSGAL